MVFISKNLYLRTVRAFKYRIYPTKKQVEVLNFTIDHCRWLYNTALEQRREAYRIARKSISLYEQIKELPLLKEQFPEYTQIHSQVLQNVLKRVDFAYQRFFHRVKIKAEKAGYPRFHGKERYDSLCYPQSGFAIKKNKIELSKIGIVKAVIHRPVPEGSKIKACTIKREGGKWFVMFACEVPNMIAPKKVVGSAVGIDLGLTNFAVLSNGSEIANPKYLKQSEAKLKELQSKYSKGKSKTVRRKLTNLHKKVANQRRDFQHKLSYSLVHGFDLIAYEDLTIKKMIVSEDNNLQKYIHDAAWGSFISMLMYKAESAGTTLIAVNPKGTTQRCSQCSSVVKKSLSERSHKCPVCGFEASRDYNAALNIHKLGISLVGLEPSEVRLPSGCG